MSKPLTLDTSAAAYHGLSLAVGNAREGSKAIKVDKAALAALMRDHGRALGALKECGVQTQDAPDGEGEQA